MNILCADASATSTKKNGPYGLRILRVQNEHLRYFGRA